jgi:hypothetical protein
VIYIHKKKVFCDLVKQHKEAAAAADKLFACAHLESAKGLSHIIGVDVESSQPSRD